MKQDDPYLAAICDAPDEDTPRLEYARKLISRGDPRGEFIQLQCEIARLGIQDSGYDERDRKLMSMLREHEREWLGGLWGRLSDWTFTRGFLSDLAIDGRSFFPTSDGRYMFRVPLKSDQLAELLPQLPPTLTTLVLSANLLGAAGARILVAADHLRLLASLDLSGYQHFSKATDWDEYEANVGAEGASIIAQSNWARRLRWLNLSLNRIDDEAAIIIADSPHLQTLHSFRMHESNDEPYMTRKPWFAESTVTRLRASFGNRLDIRQDCPRGTNPDREYRRYPG